MMTAYNARNVAGLTHVYYVAGGLSFIISRNSYTCNSLAIILYGSFILKWNLKVISAVNVLRSHNIDQHN